MKTICFINNKGGVGKTATVTTVSHMLAAIYNKKVLMVDMDPQGNTSARFSKVDYMAILNAILNNKQVDNDLSVEDILLNPNMDIKAAIQKTEYEGLDILPSHLTLAEAEERIKADIKQPQQFKLKQQLENVKNDYDYCLIDCSPSISLLNINALAASDEAYIPLRTDGDSLVGLAISMNLINTVQMYNPLLKVGGFFLTQFSDRKNVAKGIFDILKDMFPEEYTLPITIPVTKLLEENSLMQQPLLGVDSGKNKSKATLAYLKLTEYIMAENKAVFLNEMKVED